MSERSVSALSIADEKAKQYARRFAIGSALLLFVGLNGLVLCGFYGQMQVQFAATGGPFYTAVKSGDSFQARRLLGAMNAASRFSRVKALVPYAHKSIAGTDPLRENEPAGLFAVRFPLDEDMPSAGYIVFEPRLFEVSLICSSILSALLAAAIFRWVKRTHRSLAQDLVIPIVTFTEQLRFCLDGATTEARPSPLKGPLHHEFTSALRKVSALNDRVRSMELLKAEAEKARALGALAAQVSHDIRNPLSALLAVSRKIKGLDLPEQKLLDSCNNRIRLLADDLMKQARETLSRSTTLERLPIVELQQLIQNSIAEIQHVLSVRGARISLELEEPTEGFVYAQPTKLTSVIANVLQNAAEALPSRGGQVSVATRSFENVYEIRITDDGKGMSPSDLEKVGALGWTKDKEGGNGFGIYFAIQTIRQWGGAVDINSQLNIGTEVRLRLCTP